MKSNRSLSDLEEKETHLAARAALALSDEARHEVPAEVRQRAIEGITGAMRLRKRQKRMRSWAMASAAIAVAASIIIVIGYSRASEKKTAANNTNTNTNTNANTNTNNTAAPTASFVRGSPVIVHGSTQKPLTDGHALEVGDRVIATAGSRSRLTVAFASGSYVTIDDGAELLLTSAAPSTTFELTSGSLHADVVKLPNNERFTIRTSDAEIEVRGTSFDVSRVSTPDPTCGNGTTTRVKVREGVVAVRSGGTETLVRPNESWPSGCRTTAAVAASEQPPTATQPSGAHERRLDVPVPAASDLAAQNDLFEVGLSKKRAGDAVGAIAVFEQFLGRYPSSHLAQSARAERMKLLRGIDAERSRVAARDYLKKHPNGFAHRDAELILSGGD